MRRSALALAAVAALAAPARADILTEPPAASTAAVLPYLDVRSQRDPQFSHDGALLSFVTAINGEPQLWVMPARGGFPVEVTYGDDRSQFSTWSPSDDVIVYGVDHGGNENAQLYSVRPDGSQRRALTPGEDRVRHNTAVFAPDGKSIAFGSNKRDSASFDVVTMDLATGAQRVLYAPGGPCGPVAFSHDGRSLLVERDYDNYNSDLYLVDVAGGEATLLTPHAQPTVYRGSGFSADDRAIILTSDAGRQFVGRFALDIASHALRALDADAHDVDDLTVSPDGQRLAWVVNRDGYGELTVSSADGSGERTIGAPPGYAHNLSFSPDGQRLAFDASGALPPRVFVADLSGNGAAVALTNASLGGIAPESLVMPRLVSFRSFDGRTIPAWYFEPRDRNGRIPVVVDVHGGPESQDLADFYAYAQLLVSRGFGVLDPNVRGSTGYGKTYLHLADVRKREDSVKDLHAAYRWLVDSGTADPHRVALYGGSYGGYMVLAGLTNFPGDWAAGIDVVGISNFVTFLENTSAYRRKQREAVYGSLANDRAFLESISPSNHADRIRAPLMIIMGKNDPRVPASEGQQIADAVRAHGVPVDLTIFPDEGHGIVHQANRDRAYPAMLDFLERYLKPTP